MEQLLIVLKKLTGLADNALTPVLTSFEPVVVSAHTTLLAPGTVCQEIWFVASGSIRAYYHLEERKRSPKGICEEKINREVTDWLVSAGGLLTAMRSFSGQVPSSYHIETLEASVLYALSYGN